MFVVCRQLNGNHGEWTNGDDMPDPIEDSRFFAFQEVVFDFTMRELILLRSMMANHHLTMEEVITFHSECRYVHPPFDIIVGEYWVYASRLARFRREVPTENCIMLFRLYSSPLIHSALNGSHGEWTNSDDVFSQRVMKNARFLASKSEYWDMMTRAAQDELVNKYARVLQAKDLNSQIEWLPEERVKYLYLAQEYFAARNEPANPAQIRNHALVTFQNDIISETFGFADPNPFSVLDEKPSQHPVHNHNKVVDVDGRGDGTGGDGDKPPLPAPAVAAPEPPSAPKLPPIEGDGYVEEKESDESKPPKPETPPAEPPLILPGEGNVNAFLAAQKKGPKENVVGVLSSSQKSSIKMRETRFFRDSLLRLMEDGSREHNHHYTELLYRCGKRVDYDFCTHIPVVDSDHTESCEHSIVYDRILYSDPIPAKTNEKRSLQRFSLVTDKYAYNTHGLFRLQFGVWSQVSYSGGNVETFNSLGIQPIQQSEYVGDCVYEDISGENNTNIFFKTGGKKRVVLNPIEVIDDFTVGAVTYRYFAKLRTLIDHFFHESAVYNGFTQEKRRIYVLRPLLEKLKRRYANATNELVYNNMFGIAVENCQSVDVAVDTCLYFFESKLLAQRKVQATVDAHMIYSKSRVLYRPPVTGVSVDPFKRDFTTEAGRTMFTTREEAREGRRRGETVVQREYYKSCSKVYGDYHNPLKPPGGMLEPISDFEIERMKKNKVKFADPYIRFEYDESEEEECYQSVGGGFMTAVAVINHKSVRQCEMAHSRILFARDDELEQRYRATRYWDEVLNVFKSVAKHRLGKQFELKYGTELSRLVNTIKQRDRRYVGGNQIYRDWEDAGGCHSELPFDIQIQAHVQAYLHSVMSNIQVLHDDLRRFDSIQALDDYIEEVGAKLPLRRELLRKVRECVLKGVQSKVNLVQCKPHEFQKYKIVDGSPVLKYARDVVSITDEDWLKAKPHLMAYVKKILDSEFEIRKEVLPECTSIHISYQGEGEGNWLHDTYTLPDYLHRWTLKNPDVYLRGPFRYRSLIKDTSLEHLSEVINNVEDFVRDNPDSIYVITHGDDQLVALHNTNPTRFNGKLGVVYVEADINDNDGSHVDPFYRLDHATFVLRGDEVPTEAFAQLANPLMLTNPKDITQYAILRRRHGMQMCSGSVHTTYGNSKMSMNVGLCMAFNYYDEDYTNSARRVGMNVTSLYGGLTDVTFLSKNFYRDDTGVIQSYTDIASLIRKIGRVTGDVNGPSKVPVDVRFDDHNMQVVQSWVHEPDSLLVSVMRARYIVERPSYSPITGYRVQTNPQYWFKSLSRKLRDEPLNSVDVGIINHYFPGDFITGESEYRKLIQEIVDTDTYGVVIKSVFVDAAMKRRYGMVGVVE